MGGRETDVPRAASAMVLLDDDFGSIGTTIRLGRRIYDNLRKAIGHLHPNDLAASAGAGVFGLLLLEWLKGRWFRADSE